MAPGENNEQFKNKPRTGNTAQGFKVNLGLSANKNNAVPEPVKPPKSPAFIRTAEIGEINGYHLGQMCMKIVGSTYIKCVQQVKGLWRIYTTTEQARATLVTNGLNSNGKHIKIYRSNPFRTGTLNAIASGADANVDMVRLLIKDLPTSVSDDDIKHMMEYS